MRIPVEDEEDEEDDKGEEDEEDEEVEEGDKSYPVIKCFQVMNERDLVI